MALTYEAISSTTLTSTASSITFSSIPATFTDLRLVFCGKMSTISNAAVKFNSDTASNYSLAGFVSTGTSVNTFSSVNLSNIQFSYYFNIDGTIPVIRTMDIFSYAGSTFKTLFTDEINDLNGSGGVVNKVATYRSISAITNIEIFSQSAAVFAVNTTATLYGIKNA